MESIKTRGISASRGADREREGRAPTEQAQGDLLPGFLPLPLRGKLECRDQ
jgi:hypothetical protein